MLDDTWQSRDFPLLLEVARQADRQPQRLWLSIAQVAEATGLSEEDVRTAAHWLSQAGLVRADR
jgi:DNA-binding IscR family transcriptional regulator